MNREAKEAFDRLEKKLDSLTRINVDQMKKINEFQSLEDKVLKTLDNRLHEIRSLVYVVLLLIAILVSLIIGVLLKTLAG